MRTSTAAAFTLAALLAFSGVALAQEQGGGPGPDEIKKKIVEIERLMKSAEESLARSTDTRSAQEKAAEAARKILDQKSRDQTGKSAEELRKEAESGSQQARETLEKLTQEAGQEATQAAEKIKKLMEGSGGSSGSAGQGVKELIEKIKGEGQGASDGIKWILENAVKKGGGGPPPPPEGPKDGKYPKKEEEKPDPKKDEKPAGKKKPEGGTEPPKSPEFQQWYAELPPQVRKAYDTQDWDSIPPKWRELLKDWTMKMAEKMEEAPR